MVYEPDLRSLQQEIDDITADGRVGVGVSRSENDGVRYAEWQGQSPDGLKLEDRIGERPEPFEGATDSRCHLVDAMVNEDVMLCLIAMLRSQVMVKGMGAEDSAKAGRMAVLLKWILNNQLGLKWIKEHVKLANYYFADTPGCGFLSIEWLEKQCLEYKELTIDKLAALYVEMVMAGASEDEDPALLQESARVAAMEFVEMMMDETSDDEVAMGLLMSFFDYLTRRRARKVVKELRETGTASFPAPYTEYRGVHVEADRLFQDVVFRSGMTELDRTPSYFRIRWYDETELWDRVATDGWKKTFVEELLNHEGNDAFSDFYLSRMRTRHATPQDHKRMYQVVHVYYRAVNSDYVPGRYMQTFSKFVTEFAHERRLIRYAHRNYPGVLYQREATSKWVMDSRGLPEILGASQSLVKKFTDDFGDNATISGLPPMVTLRRNRGDDLYLAPLRELQARQRGDYEWLKPPEYPRAGVDMITTLERDAAHYNGRPVDGVPEQTVQLHQEWKVIWWMAHVREAVSQILSLYQQFMPEEELAKIVDTDGEPLFGSKEEIQGQYDVLFSIDMRMFDPEFMSTVGSIVKDILLVIDRDRTIDPTPIVESMLYMLLPHVAEKSLRSRDRAVQDELTDEFQKYVEIMGGKEPELPDDGSIDYEVRLGMYRDLEEKNPQAYTSYPEDRQEILKSRLQRMNVLAQQYGENVDIGRQGGREALET